MEPKRNIKLEKHMEIRGLTQTKLAELVGTTNDYISQIVRGRIPGRKMQKKLADYFLTTVDELFYK